MVYVNTTVALEEKCRCLTVSTHGAEDFSRGQGGWTLAGSFSTAQQELAEFMTQSSYSDPEIPCLVWV